MLLPVCRQPPQRRAALRKRALLELLHAERCDASDAAAFSAAQPVGSTQPDAVLTAKKHANAAESAHAGPAALQQSPRLSNIAGISPNAR